MSFINEQQKEINCKVVYFGPALGGKTTTLRAVYRNVHSGKGADPIAIGNDDDRTLFFDFVPLHLGKIKDYTIRLHLYTIPGQAAYDAQRKLIAKGTDGVVFVADSQIQRMEANLASLHELQKILAVDGIALEEFPMIIQYNKRDLPQAAPLAELREVLNPSKVPDFETVATKHEGILDALKAITARVLHDLKTHRAD
ncbi:MAG: GTPase domain-containing protein [Deltaproteobacteria bacterium]|nr:GTPase domain-containing protein [Deltaproteobacteria bacterium]